MSSDGRTSPKTILITGASSGIGAAFARLAGARRPQPRPRCRRQRELEEVARGSGQDALPGRG